MATAVTSALILVSSKNINSTRQVSGLLFYLLALLFGWLWAALRPAVQAVVAGGGGGIMLGQEKQAACGCFSPGCRAFGAGLVLVGGNGPWLGCLLLTACASLSLASNLSLVSALQKEVPPASPACLQGAKGLTALLSHPLPTYLGTISFPIFILHGALGQLFYKKIIATKVTDPTTKPNY